VKREIEICSLRKEAGVKKKNMVKKLSVNENNMVHEGSLSLSLSQYIYIYMVLSPVASSDKVLSLWMPAASATLYIPLILCKSALDSYM
jgi:hypothetical protein